MIETGSENLTKYIIKTHSTYIRINTTQLLDIGHEIRVADV